MQPGELETLLALAEERTLQPDQRAIAARLQSDPACRQAIVRQRHVAGALRHGGPAVPRDRGARLSAKSGRSTAPRRRTIGRWVWPVKLVGTSAAAVLAVGIVAVTLRGGSVHPPTATQVAAIWTRPATGGTVSADPAHPTQLDVSFHGIVYPNYHDREGWHPVAARYDRIGRLRTATVFYQTGARRAAYTVVPSTRLTVPAGARHLRVAGLSLIEFRSGDRWIITFVRNGNTCVLTAAAPRERQWLVKLAIWKGGPAVTRA